MPEMRRGLDPGPVPGMQPSLLPAGAGYGFLPQTTLCHGA